MDIKLGAERNAQSSKISIGYKHTFSERVGAVYRIEGRNNYDDRRISEEEGALKALWETHHITRTTMSCRLYSQFQFCNATGWKLALWCSRERGSRHCDPREAIALSSI